MSKKKNGGFFSRLIWTVIIVGFVALGFVLFVSTLPSVGVLINYTTSSDIPFVGTATLSVAIALKGFGALFGGALDEVAFNSSASIGDKVFEAPEGSLPSLGEEFAFNYLVFIGVVLVLIGVVLAILFFRKKTISLLGALLIVVGAILLCLDCLLYTSINESALGSLKEIEGVTVIDVPSLLLGIFSALSGITVFFHALTIKK